MRDTVASRKASAAVALLPKNAGASSEFSLLTRTSRNISAMSHNTIGMATGRHLERARPHVIRVI